MEGVLLEQLQALHSRSRLCHTCRRAHAEGMPTNKAACLQFMLARLSMFLLAGARYSSQIQLILCVGGCAAVLCAFQPRPQLQTCWCMAASRSISQSTTWSACMQAKTSDHHHFLELLGTREGQDRQEATCSCSGVLGA